MIDLDLAASIRGLPRFNEGPQGSWVEGWAEWNFLKTGREISERVPGFAKRLSEWTFHCKRHTYARSMAHTIVGEGRAASAAEALRGYLLEQGKKWNMATRQGF